MRNSYHTQQRCALLAFLSAHADEQFTVEQLLTAMGDEAPGRSTVYRALDRLVEEGTVRRFAPESGGSAAYQAMDPGHCDAHLHLKCVDCGRLIHLDTGVSDALQADLLRAAGFTVDGRDDLWYLRRLRRKAGRPCVRSYVCCSRLCWRCRRCPAARCRKTRMQTMASSISSRRSLRPMTLHGRSAGMM